MKDIEIRGMEVSDHGDCVELWSSCEGIGVSAADGREEIGRFLERNPGTCFVARSDGALAGTVLCGHDGRRGYLYHLAVAPSHRRRGLARSLVARAMEGLRSRGIGKCHLFVYASNALAKAFYESEGWKMREELDLFSLDV